MKLTTYNILFFLFTISFSYGQPTVEWQVSLGGSESDLIDQGNSVFNNVILTSDGGVAFAGTSKSNDGDVTGHHGTAAKSDIWVGKLDSLGNLEWQKSLGGTGNEVGKGLAQTPDGGYIIIGESWSDDGDVSGHHDSTNTMDVWIVKLDATGNIQWEHSYGGSLNDTGIDISPTNDGGYLFAADTWSSDYDVSQNNGSIDFWIVKIDSAGTIQWENSYGGTGGERIRSMRLTPDGGIIAIGNTTSTDGDITSNPFPGFASIIWVLKVDNMGNKQWDQCYGGSFLDFGNDIRCTPDGGYILCTSTSSTDGDITTNHGSGDAWVAKLDSVGSIEWSRCYGGLRSEKGATIRATIDGGYVIGAVADSASGDVSVNIGQADCWLIKTDSLGNIEWDGSYGGTAVENLTTALQTPDGGFILGAQSQSNDVDVSGHHGPLNNDDIWIAKLSFTTGIKDDTGNIVNYSLAPNPVSDHATLQFELTAKEHIIVELMDISGRLVATIANKFMTTGVHEMEINMNDRNIESGLYFVKLSAGNAKRTIKLIKN